MLGGCSRQPQGFTTIAVPTFDLDRASVPGRPDRSSADAQTTAIQHNSVRKSDLWRASSMRVKCGSMRPRWATAAQHVLCYAKCWRSPNGFLIEVQFQLVCMSKNHAPALNTHRTASPSLGCRVCKCSGFCSILKACQSTVCLSTFLNAAILALL